MRILVLECDSRTVRVLQKGLEANGFAVDLATNGREGLELAGEINYDAIILDSALPRLDGSAVLKRLRQSGNSARILMTGKRHDVSAIVQSLRAGADDYLAKPYAFEEVLARTQALLRRPQQLLDTLTVDDLVLDRVRSRVTRRGKRIKLTQREYAVLEYLMRNAGRIVTRTMLVEHVWNLGYEGLTNIVDVYINYLRTKVDRGYSTRLIRTERGAGYTIQSHTPEDEHIPPGSRRAKQSRPSPDSSPAEKPNRAVSSTPAKGFPATV
ncbi:MAG TPA: response regulator transcription factor [Candidatus Angelobacter sp.]|nr:response regulator transcription factor [Candidatus Angelobacter sp.]